MTGRVAILIDGDNISHTHAPCIFRCGQGLGRADVARVYGDAARRPGWGGVAGLRLVHSGTGKNAADLLLVIEAMELALIGGIDAFVIATSDGDFTHLALRLRELGRHVTGTGEAKAPAGFRQACSRFETLAPVPQTPSPAAAKPVSLDDRICAVIVANANGAPGMRMTDLGARMHSQFGVRISLLPERTWRAYLAARPHLFELDPRGADARVRLTATGAPGRSA